MSRIILILLLTLVAQPLWAENCDQAKHTAQLATQIKDICQRITLWSEALSRCPRVEYAFHLGESRLFCNDPKGALAAFQQVEQLRNPDSRDADLLLAFVLGRKAEAYLMLDQLPEALAAIDEAFGTSAASSDPKLAWLWRVRKAVDTHPGRQQMAAADISRALTSRAMGSSPRIDLYVLFDTDKARPNAQGMAQSRALGQALMPYADAKTILILGHTDERGTDEYNQELSERRAMAVVELLGQWYPELKDKLSAKGRGERKPRYPGNTDEDYRLNRRVEVQVRL